MNIIVSACLLGVNCKYNGESNINEDTIKLKEKYQIIPVCPEQLGGLVTPRECSEITIIDSKRTVLTSSGIDVTNEFIIGAKETLKLAKMFNCKIAVLKERSPSCGSEKIYDGTFKGKIIRGQGVTAQLLRENGIKVYSENNFYKYL